MSYEKMEEVLKRIHKEFISLDREEVKETKKLLKETLIKLTEYMSEEDSTFKQLFKEFYFGGSFYHNLKIKRPDEFDIDFLLILPKCETCQVKNCGCITIDPSSIPGFLSFKIKENYCTPIYRKFCENGYIQTNLIFNWMKSLVYKALNRLRAEREITSYSEEPPAKEVILYTECAPAFKIAVKGKFGFIYIDLAAAFKLDDRYWPRPEKGYRQNTSNTNYFSIVPVSPKGYNGCWRFSFQEQEKEVIANKERLKPALRLLKIMRNNLNHKISSYMLKTLILEEADRYKWKEQTLSHTFMILLKKYNDCLRNKWLPYFWMNEINLLDGIKPITLINHYNEINKLYNKIEREYSTNSTVVAEVILKKNSEDYNKFMEDWNGPKWLRALYTDFTLSDTYHSDEESIRYISCNDELSSIHASDVVVTSVLIGIGDWCRYSTCLVGIFQFQ